METSGRILFVDDDPRILEGLRDLLRKQRKKWDMHFALGGEEAVSRLDREAFDVVVSDIKMPRVDGVAVLKHTRAKHPETVRIALSGETGQALALSAVSEAHQSLAKPCRLGELESTIGRALHLRAQVSDPALRAKLGELDELPGLPRTYTKLVSVLEDENSGMADVSRVVEEDIAVTAKILQLVNSAFFGVGRPVKTIHQAVQFLGVDLVKSLLLSSGAFSKKLPPDQAKACEQVQNHSAQTAHIASTIAEPASRRDSFTAGLLHDIGWLVQINCGPPTIAKSLASGFEVGSEPNDEALHAAIGAYLLGLWGLPLDVIHAVGTHHAPLDDGEPSPIAMNVRRAERALQTAQAERAPDLHARAIAIAQTLVPPVPPVTQEKAS
jgi:HD-like signal output (HDOD) protein